MKGKQETKRERSRKQKNKTECERQAKTKQRHRASKQSYFQDVVESERSGFQRRRGKLQVAGHVGASFGETLGRTAESKRKVEKKANAGDDVHQAEYPLDGAAEMLELSDEKATSRIGESGFLGDPRGGARPNSSGAPLLCRRAWLWTSG